MFPELLIFSNIGLFLLRAAVGIIFIYHAVPKLKNPKGMAQGMGMANAGGVVALLGAVEFLSGLGLVLGIYAQLSALVLAVVMAGAIVMKISKWHVPFSAMDKTGWEFDLALLAANIVILTTGSGAIAIL